MSRGPKPKHSQQPPGVVQNWSALQCSKKNTEQCGYDHAPVTRGRMRAQFPLPHGPLPYGAVSRVVCPLAPPFTRTVAPPPRPRARAGSRAGQRSARPGAPPPAVPQRRGRRVQSTTTPPVPRAISRCGPPQSCAQGARPRASCSRGAVGSMSMTGRRRVQTEHSPGGLSVRLPWPPCQGLEHQASHNPPHASRPPPPPPHAGARGQGQARRGRVTRHALQAPPACTPHPLAPRAPHTQARRHLPPVCATTGYEGGQQSGRPWDRTTAIRLAQSCRHKGEC